jgi:hypothetical protein
LVKVAIWVTPDLGISMAGYGGPSASNSKSAAAASGAAYRCFADDGRILAGDAAMPMHDWTRVDPNDYHDFHGAWIYAIRTALNNGILPGGYYALAEHTTPPIIPDVVTLSIPDDPPVPALGNGASGPDHEPSTTIVATARRVAIHHARSRQIVAIIELVSPTNKSRRPEFVDLIGKTVQALRQGIHVMLIDPFPPTRLDPNGIHATVWKELIGKAFTPPEGKPLTLASYVAMGANRFTTYVEPIAVGDRLPDMPLFLSSEYYVATPLEETYDKAWQGYPAFLKTIMEGG